MDKKKILKIIVVIVVIIIFFNLYSSAMQRTNDQVLADQKKRQEDNLSGNTILSSDIYGTQTYTSADKLRIAPLVSGLYSDLRFSGDKRKLEIWAKVYALSNKDFLLLHDQYNVSYLHSKGKSLLEEVKDISYPGKLLYGDEREMARKYITNFLDRSSTLGLN